MSITEQPLPQYPGPLRLLPAVARGLDDIITDIRSANDQAVQTLTAVRVDADEKIHALEVTAARLAAQRDRLDLENSALVAAAFVLVADGIRREEELTAAVEAAEADRDQARRERNIARANERISSEITAAMSRALAEKHLELRRTCEQVADLFGENRQLRTELDDAITRLAAGKRGRFRRGR